MLRIIEKIETVKRWPSTEPEHIKCKVCDIEDSEKEFNVTLHKNEVAVIEKLNALQKSLKLYPNTMNELWATIESFGQTKYEQGCSDAEGDGA
jgi:hypothetical protein